MGRLLREDELVGGRYRVTGPIIGEGSFAEVRARLTVELVHTYHRAPPHVPAAGRCTRRTTRRRSSRHASVVLCAARSADADRRLRSCRLP